MKKISFILVVAIVLSFVQFTFASDASSYVLLGELEPTATVTIDSGNYGVDCTLMTPDTLINIGRVEYDYGVSFHPCYDGAAYLEYDISGKGYKTFYAVFGKDAASGAQVGEAGIKGTKVGAEIYLDGEKVAESGNLGYPDTYEFKVDVTGKSTLKLVVTDGEDGVYCDTASFANALLSVDSVDTFTIPSEISVSTPEPTEEPTPEPTTDPDAANKDKVYLSDMAWSSFANYTGCNAGIPVRDANNSEEDMYLAGSEYYDKGVCFHAGGNPVTYIEVNIEGLGFKNFAGSVGIAASELYDVTMGTCDFIFYVDGVEVLRKEAIDYETIEDVFIDVENAKTFKIEVTEGGDGISGDWGAIGDALFTKKTEEEYKATPEPTDTPAPTDTPNPEETSAPAKETDAPIGSKETAAPSESKGCGSVIGLSTISAVAICGAVIFLKKKEF